MHQTIRQRASARSDLVKEIQAASVDVADEVIKLLETTNQMITEYFPYIGMMTKLGLVEVDDRENNAGKAVIYRLTNKGEDLCKSLGLSRRNY